ncbi:MAG TPA: transcription termination factor NusA [Candidatus Saccharimonadales bacterium]|nr:transcription termination factor NusA [Candidatus Saccharimonadales bacterium]
MAISTFAAAINQLADERGLPRDIIIDAIETAVAAAYRKDYADPEETIKAVLDEETGEFNVTKVFTIIDPAQELALMNENAEAVEGDEPKEFVQNIHSQLTLDEAKELLKNETKAMHVSESGKKTAAVGDTVQIPLEPHSDFGRIAAMTAKQVISQKLREAEKEILYAEYKEKQGQLINGYVQQVEGYNVIMNIGKLNGLMIASDQIPNQHYYPGQRLKILVYNVEETPRGPRVLVTRSSADFITKLFELEVPEIASGAVAVKVIAREAGVRTKMAVTATQPGLDPVGSCVGQRGTRVQAVLSEIGDEKIDIILYSEDTEALIRESLKPAKIEKIVLKKKANRAEVVVPEDQLSLAIGKNGQNVRLASKLSGWEIDILKTGEASLRQKEDKVEEMLAEEKPAADVAEPKIVKKTTKKTEGDGMDDTGSENEVTPGDQLTDAAQTDKEILAETPAEAATEQEQVADEAAN